MQFDFVCMNKDCISNRKSFFKFHTDSIHIVKKHQVKSIHPLSYTYIFNQDKLKPKPTNESLKCSSLVQLLQLKDKTYQSIKKIVKNIIENINVVPEIQKAIFIYENMDLENLLKQMSQGNYQLLKYLSDFSNQSKCANFKDFIAFKIFSMQQQMERKLNSLKNLISQLLQQKHSHSIGQIFHFDESKPLPIESSQKDFIKQQKASQKQYSVILDNQEEKQQKQNLKAQDQLCRQALIDREEEQQMPSKQQFEYEQQYEAEDEEYQVSKVEDNFIKKTKQIKKGKRKGKRNKIFMEDTLQQKDPTTIIVRQCNNTQQTLYCLQEKYPDITTIHIFDEKLANKQSVKFILTHFPFIKKISFNCYFEFEPSILKEVKPQILKRLTIEPKWEISTFFTDYCAYFYFHNLTFRRERKQAVSIRQMIDLLPSNNSLWISDATSNNIIQWEPLNPQQITTLNFINIQSDLLAISLSTRFTNICVLILKRVWINTGQFKAFIRANRNIHTIVISSSKCKNGLYDMKSLFSEIIQVLKLQKLCLRQKYVPLEDILKFDKLTHLNIDESDFLVNFTNNGGSTFEKIKRLHKLQHLGLYKIKSFASNDLSYLSQQCLETLQYLNLGQTNIDDSAFKFITKMSKLQYLNLDYTNITGQQFARCCYKLKKFGNLEYLSIEGQRGKNKHKITQPLLKEISEYLPALKFLNIAYNDNIRSYCFFEFTKLKILRVDRQQYEALNGHVLKKVYLQITTSRNK